MTRRPLLTLPKVSRADARAAKAAWRIFICTDAPVSARREEQPIKTLLCPVRSHQNAWMDEMIDHLRDQDQSLSAVQARSLAKVAMPPSVASLRAKRLLC